MIPQRILAGSKKLARNKTAHLLGGTALLLSFLGLLMIYDVSVVLAFREFNDQYWFFKNQTVWLLAGIGGGYVASRIDYHFWKKLAFPVLVLTIILLALVLVPPLSSEVYGARTRLSFPVGVPFLNHLNVQPSELAKLALVIYLATLFDKGNRSLAKFLTILAIVNGLIMLEPDLGNALLVSASSTLVFFASGASVLELLSLIAIGILGVTAFTFSSNYRIARLLTFLNPSLDPQGSSYQINQILIALGSGGLLGLGLGHSRQKFQYLPEVVTDSIFAIIGEELGFILAVIILGLLMAVVWLGLKTWESAKDRFGKMLSAGITGIIGFQILVNLGGITNLLPLTGVPLPFISYGGSNLTITLISVGILMNIARKGEKERR